MEPESHSPANQKSSNPSDHILNPLKASHANWDAGHELHGLEWVLTGPHGLRVGWAVLLFASLYYIFELVVGTVFYSAGLVADSGDNSANAVFLSELVPFLALGAATILMALFESRRVSSYYLAGRQMFWRFVSGTATGFFALSILVALLDWCGWLHIVPTALPIVQSFHSAAIWGCAFLLVGLVEEGLFRCYPLFTLTKGISFWWALAAQAAACSYLALKGGGVGAWGVYLAAAVGIIPCFALHIKSGARSAFWQAAWVTSTIFGLYHTWNSGENWIGIFAASFIGFVFCVSVRLTGSAWWAIGCHASWDWAETYFYGTADSGIQGQGHLLFATPTGNALWSGGTDGPEGSPLVIGVILVLLLILILTYGRSKERVSVES